MSAPREVTMSDAPWCYMDSADASAWADGYNSAIATLATPPAVSEPYEKIEELPAVLPAQNSAAQTEQDTEATVGVDGELERLKEYVAAAGTMQATHKGTPHTANDKPLNLSDLARVLAVAEAAVALCESTDASEWVKLHGPLTAAVAALRGATEMGEGA